MIMPRTVSTVQHLVHAGKSCNNYHPFLDGFTVLWVGEISYIAHVELGTLAICKDFRQVWHLKHEGSSGLLPMEVFVMFLLMAKQNDA